MSDVDLVITGGRIVDEAGVYEASIAVKDGRIAAIGALDDLPSAARTIDVQGQHVFPGIIDPHIHLQTFANPFDINIKTETKTAAVGGVTTIVPTLLNRENPQRDFFEYVPWCRDAVDKYASVDVGFSAVIGTTSRSTNCRGWRASWASARGSSTWPTPRTRRRCSASRGR